jgi:hypothetical protein
MRSEYISILGTQKQRAQPLQAIVLGELELHSIDKLGSEKLTNSSGQVNDRGCLYGPRVDWSAVRPSIETAVPITDPDEDPGDILYIFDSCSAGAAGTYNGPELLAACGWDQIAGASLATSFTQTLINKLRELDGRPKTVAMIYSEMFQEASDNQIAAMPVQIPRKGRDSITLSRLQGNRPRKPESFDFRQNYIGERPRSENRVLISVELQDDIDVPDIQQWTRWLATNVPSGILSADITIQSAFQGSTLLLLAVPVEVWTMLPADKDYYNYVGYVGSEIAVPRPTHDLPIRPAPPSGSENQPPGSEKGSMGGSSLSLFR